MHGTMRSVELMKHCAVGVDADAKDAKESKGSRGNTATRTDLVQMLDTGTAKVEQNALEHIQVLQTNLSPKHWEWKQDHRTDLATIARDTGNTGVEQFASGRRELNGTWACSGSDDLSQTLGMATRQDRSADTWGQQVQFWCTWPVWISRRRGTLRSRR